MSRKKLYLLWIGLWIVVIWGHSLQPAVASDSESAIWLDFINGILGKFGGAVSMHFVRKLAHFTEYFILGVLIANAYRAMTEKLMSHLSVPVLGGLMTAFIDETIQLFVEGRSGQVSDIWIDFAGGCVGIAIFLFFIYNKKRNLK